MHKYLKSKKLLIAVALLLSGGAVFGFSVLRVQAMCAIDTDCGTINPVDGVCAATHYSCSVGASANNVAGATQWTWSCLGSKGGLTANCAENMPLPVNGSCAAAAYNCNAGTSSGGSYNGAGYYSWSCLGINGGSNASCSQTVAVNGVCAATAYNCSPGTASSQSYNSGTGMYSWYCNGYYGGASPYCTQYIAVNGVCNNASSYACSAGTSINNVKGATYFTWNCQGLNGGATSAQCSHAISVTSANLSVSPSTIPYGGYTTMYWSSGPNAEQCITRQGIPNSDTNYAYRTPNGSATIGPFYSSQTFNGYCINNTDPSMWYYGASGNPWGDFITVTVSPLNGVCAATAYNCSAGTSVNNSWNATTGTYTWNCNGANGGANPACSQTLVPGVSLTANSANGGTTGYAYAGEGATLTWTASYSPSSCNIYQNGSLYTSVAGTVTSWTTPGLPEGSTSYRVDCINGGGTGQSNTVTYSVPTSPSALSASCPNPGGTANFSWTLPGAYSTTYFRYYNSPPAYPDYTTACNPAKTPPNGSCIVVTGSSVSQAATPGTAYYYYIHSRDGYGNWSNAVGYGPFNCSVNGVCGGSLNSCSAGTFVDVADSGTQYLWNCNGLAGGTNASCSMYIPVNGVCGASNNLCSAGTLSDIADSGTQYLWNCNGQYGGSNASCSQMKPVPNAPSIGGQTSPIINTSYPYTFQASDPMGQTVAYNIDWDNNGTVDQTSAYSTSNWIFTQNNSWTSAGAKTFKAYTSSSDGRSSGWTSYPVTVPTPVNGTCNNSAINACTAGAFTDVADDANYNYWYCAGSYGGSNSPTCSFPKTNGVCSTTVINGCTSGSFVDVADDANNNYWYCAGANNGVNSPTCAIAKINGACAATHYNCSPGTSVNNLSNTTTWTWNCNGSNNGTNSGACSETKPNPVAPTIGGPTSGAIGTSYTYTFTATDPLASTVRYDIDWDNNGTVDQSSAYGASGWTFSQPNSWAGSGTKTFKAYTETSDGRTSGWTTYNVTIVPVSTATISTSATPLAYNGAATITWSSTDATSCSLTANGSAWQSGLSGSVSTGALTANVTYAISCVGTGGNSNNSVTVYVNPSVTISASPTSIAYNAASAITWSSANASTCNIQKGATPNWQTTLSGTGVTTGALTSTTVFTLTCTGPGGTTANTSATVTVAPLNGSCAGAPTHYTCGSYNTSVSNVSGPLQWTWTCNGANGGTNANCSETKPAPNAPTIGGPTQGQVSTSYTFTFQATNPSGDGVVYAIDWDNNGTVDQYLPATGTTTQGTQLSTANNWGGSGVKNFKARTETNGGPVSGWTSYSIQIYGVPVVTWTPGSSATIPYNGTISFSYSSTDSVSCSYYDLNPSTGAIQTTIWSNGATSSSWTNQGPYQADFRRKVVCQNPFSQTGSAEFYVTVLQNNAACGAFTVPSYVTPSQVFTATSTMVNSGTNPWTTTALANYFLWSASSTWGTTSVSPTVSTVGAGGTGTFIGSYTAPAVEGDYGFSWQMRPQFNSVWANPFGATCVPATANGTLIRVKNPLLAVSPTTYGFPDQVAGDPAKTMNIHVSNLGGGNITGGTITGFSGPFTCTSNCNFTLGPGGSQDISISFAPSATGTFSTALSVNATGQASIPVSAYGNGVEKLVVSTDPTATVSVNPLDFGEAATTRAKYLNFTIKNQSLTQSGGTVAGITPDNPVFTCVSGCNFTLPPSSSSTVSIQTIRLKFVPTVVGTSTSNMTINTTPSLVIGLTGVGVKPVFTTTEQ